MDNVGLHFNKQHNKYIKSVFETNREFYDNINKRINPYLKGVLADIGNGGIFTYDTKKLKKIYAIDVSFKNNNLLRKYDNVQYILEDARKIKSIEPESCDIVLFQLVLHHITCKSAKETRMNTQKALEQAMKLLKKNGKLIVVETTVARPVELVEEFLYFFDSALLKLFKKPMVFFFSKKTMSRLIKNVGFKNIQVSRISFGKKMDLMNGIMPGVFIGPTWLAYNRCNAFIATK